MAGSGRSWYYKRGEKKYGPVSTVQLQKAAQNGMLLPTDLLWREGMKVWAPASKLKGLTFGVSAPQPTRQRESAFPSLGDLLFTEPSTPEVQKKQKPQDDMLSMLPPPDPALLALKAAREKPVASAAPKAPPRRIYTQQSESRSTIHIEPAGLFRRYLALFLDNLMVALIDVILVIPIMIFLAVAILPNVPDGEEQVATGLQIAFASIQILYFMLADCTPAGASPGKLMVGIRVRDMEGQKLSLGTMVARGFLKVIGLSLILPLLTAFFSSYSQTMHDLLTGSVVVRR